MTVLISIAIPWLVFGFGCIWAIRQGKREKVAYLQKRAEQERKAASLQGSLFETHTTQEALSRPELAGAGASR